MAYQQNVPQSTDKIKDSQNDLLQNFQTIKTGFDENHYAFDTANEGKHKYVSFPEQVGAPTVAVDERAIYSKLSTLTSVAELFTRKENNGDEIEFTASLDATPGWTILPSGIILKWGASTNTGAQTVVLPVGASIPVFTNIFSVQLTVKAAGATDADLAVRVVDFSNPAQFDVYASPRSTTGSAAVTFEYLVIGA